MCGGGGDVGIVQHSAASYGGADISRKNQASP